MRRNVPVWCGRPGESWAASSHDLNGAAREKFRCDQICISAGGTQIHAENSKLAGQAFAGTEALSQQVFVGMSRQEAVNRPWGRFSFVDKKEVI